MTTDKSQDPKTESSSDEAPALFATIHHKSEHRPDGYTEADLRKMNLMANGLSESAAKDGS